MRGSGFLQGVALGAAVSSAVVAAAAAMAGTGVGGIMNLGQSNTVDNATTSLGGTNASAMLDVSNTSSAPNTGTAISGRSASRGGSGVFGTNPAVGSGYGVRGNAPRGTGVYGQSATGLGGKFLSVSGNAVLATGQSANPTLRVQNTSTGPGAAFETDPSAAPFTVNSSAVVPNLNADQFDGRDSTEFARLGGLINGDGTISQGSGFTVQRYSTGEYQVSFPAGTLSNGNCPPIVVVTAFSGVAHAVISGRGCSGLGAGSFTAKLLDSGGVPQDAAFLFIAM
jgi:hypothetical protein